MVTSGSDTVVMPVDGGCGGDVYGYHFVLLGGESVSVVVGTHFGGDL